MRADPNTPSEILEELGDVVAAHIATHSLSAFESALQEMTEYNRLLLDLYETTGEGGSPESYARLQAPWAPLYSRWFSNYRRIIERAIERLEDDPEFATILAGLPHRLLPPVDQPAHPDLLRGALNLGSLFVYRLEHWFSRRADMGRVEKAAKGGRRLIGPEHGVYEDLVIRVVGSWENLLEYRPRLGREQRDDETDTQHWRALAADWAFFQQHLENTAEALAAAVWWRDEIGSDRYRDMLVRWRGRAMRFAQGGLFALAHRDLITSDLAPLDWDAIPAALGTKIQRGDMEGVTPSLLFEQILSNLYEHALLVTAGVMLNWVLLGRADAFALESVRDLLGRRVLSLNEDVDEDPETSQRSFSSLFRRLLSLHLAGTRGWSGLHSDAMDQLASVLDRMTEPKVASGRVYTPTTLHDRQALMPAFAVMLLAQVSPGGTTEALEDLKGLIEGAPFGSPSDHTVRRVRNFLDQVRKATDNLPPDGLALVGGLGSDIKTEESLTLLRDFLCGATASIDAFRTAQVKSAPIDEEKVNTLARSIGVQLLTGDGGIRLFRDVNFRTVEEGLEPQKITLNGADLAPFLKQPMTDFTEVTHVGQRLAQEIAERAWHAAFRRPRQEATIRFGIGQLPFWTRVERLAREVGPAAVLIVPPGATGPFRERFDRQRLGGNDPRVRVVRKPSGGPSHYWLTVNDIDVYRMGTGAPDRAVLLSALLLESVDYGKVDEDTGIVGLRIIRRRRKPWACEVEATFAQRPSFTTGPIFNLTFSLMPPKPRRRS